MKIILSLFFVLLHSVLSYAYNQFSFVKYQVENGLSHNTVWYTIQDHQGFMWFGTKGGLSRYDGMSFRREKLQNFPPHPERQYFFGK